MEARVNFSGNELINSENIQLTLKLFHWVSAFTMRLGPTQRDFFSRGDSHELARTPHRLLAILSDDSNLVGLADFAKALIKTCSLAGVPSSKNWVSGAKKKNKKQKQKKRG